jgi:hypothetical protein
MLRPSAALSLCLLTLTACPVDHVILSGDLESSTGDDGTAGMSSTDEPSDTFVGTTSGEPDPTTGEPTEPSCADMPAPPNCCEDHGEVAGAPGLCSLTADHKCVGCDYKPVLCMTHGCGSANVEDCCLSDEGETVPCDAIEPAIVVVPDPIIIPACNPPASLCADLESDCTAAGIDADRCLELAQGVCPGSKRLACERLIDECEEVSPGECDAIAKRCGSALGGCNCDAPACVDMMDAPIPTLFASCFAFPLALGCEEPSVGQCFTTLTYEGCAGLTTCEYHDCMLAIGDLASCTDATPAECAEVAACVAAEAAPWA